MNNTQFGLLIAIFSLILLITNNNYLLSHDYNNQLPDKCGTHLFIPNKDINLQKTIYFDNLGNPKAGQKYIDSPNDIFRIHFDTIGVHAPNMEDRNNNGIPDYVDSVAYYCEYVYDIYINQMGYISPYPDRGSRGSDHYDIYLWDLGDSDTDKTMGAYHQGGTYGFAYNSNQDYITMNPFIKTYSYIVLDNDYSELDSVRPVYGKPYRTFKYPGIASLKVTIAHEFYHAVQFMYGISEPSSTSIMEMSAVAMERVIFPEVPDYLSYVSLLFRNSSALYLGDNSADSGYSFSIFNQFIIEKYGVDVMKDMWENVANAKEVFTALDLALKGYNSSLGEAWCEFLDWAYYTNTRSIEDEYFSNAKELPLLEPYMLTAFEPPAKSQSGNLSPFEIRLSRFIFHSLSTQSDDTLDILLGDIDIKAASAQVETEREYFAQVANSQVANSEKLGSKDLWGYFEYDDKYICTNTHFNEGVTTVEIDYAYPNPFNANIDRSILFPVPNNTELYQKVNLFLYDSEMRQVYSNTLQVGVDNNKRVVALRDFPQELASGIYIFGVHVDDKVVLGKFAVINK